MPLSEEAKRRHLFLLKEMVRLREEYRHLVGNQLQEKYENQAKILKELKVNKYIILVSIPLGIDRIFFIFRMSSNASWKNTMK